jgi:DNA adenine methylase
VLRYHGGKWILAPWIISCFPEHHVYVEPYGGAGSVLIRKPRSYAEVFNDINGEIVNLFRVLRNPSQARELKRLAALTPYSRDEFEASYLEAEDPIEQARRTLFRSAAGFSTTGAQSLKWRTGFRGSVTRSHTVPAHDWASIPDVLESVTARLRGVVIENLSALQLIEKYDHAEALFYLDPPYPFESRNQRWAGKAYAFEMSDGEHEQLAEALHLIKGMAVISGYECPLYERLYATWHKLTRETFADRARPRVEVLWLNASAQRALNAQKAQRSMFDVAE